MTESKEEKPARQVKYNRAPSLPQSLDSPLTTYKVEKYSRNANSRLFRFFQKRNVKFLKFKFKSKSLKEAQEVHHVRECHEEAAGLEKPKML